MRLIQGIIQWWVTLPSWLRYGVAIFFVIISTALYFYGLIWPWGWILGLILFIANTLIKEDTLVLNNDERIKRLTLFPNSPQHRLRGYAGSDGVPLGQL